ncbi:MAG: SUMF1/EgtB/PvdO family nonheme iron enzyme, partial [Aggregatilineales bacterium]
MMPALTKKLRRKIINLLTPHLTTIPAQQTLVDDALFDAPNLRTKIHYSANARHFTSHLVGECDNYGEIEPGEPALVAVLEAFRDYVGVQQNETIDEIMVALQAQPPPEPGIIDDIPVAHVPAPVSHQWTQRDFRAAYDEAEVALENQDYIAATRTLQNAMTHNPSERMQRRMAKLLTRVRRNDEYDYLSEKLSTGRRINDWCDDFAEFQQEFPDYDPDDLAALCPKSIYDILPAPFAWIDIPAVQGIKLPTDEDKNPSPVDIPAYNISKYTVTNAQFAAFIEAGGYRNDAWWT